MVIRGSASLYVVGADASQVKKSEIGAVKETQVS